MKIIILGSNQVAATLAESLCVENHDITVVDSDIEPLHDLQTRLDIRTVVGEGSYPTVLKQAGIEDADLLVAMTNNDEINLIACQIAATLFQTPTKIARVKSQEYLDHQEEFLQAVSRVDVVISPEKLVMENVQRLIEHPGALQALEFADGKVQLVCMHAERNGPLVGKALKSIREHIPTVDTRVAAIFRKDTSIKPEGNTIIEEDDEVFFVAASGDILTVMSELRRLDHPYKRIVIAGGGNIGMNLAKNLEDRYQVKLIERNQARCERIAEILNKTVILQGDAADQALLIEESIEDADVFCALTNDDEANIMSAMLAKRLGAYKVMALISRPAYVDLVQGHDIDIAISPQMTTVSGLLAYIRRGDMVKVHSLRRGAAEAIEAIVHGDEQSSKVVGRSIGELRLPQGTTIGAIVRGDKVLIAHDSVVIAPNDHVILFLVDKKRIREVEQLFQVEVTF